jgi:Ser/Thr protein kinase RdoA (MazF antagonist)
LVARNPVYDAAMDWTHLDLRELADELHATNAPADAERLVRAFEEVLRLVRVDLELLPSLLAAAVSLSACVEDSSPRTVLEQWFRRSVPDDVWHERYRPLFG